MFTSTAALWLLSLSATPGPLISTGPIQGFSQSAAQDEAWQLHNTVDGIVEGRIITRRDLRDRVLGPDSGYTISSQEDLQKAHAEAFEEAIAEALRLQAGENLGSEIGDIELAVQRQIHDERRELGFYEYRDQLADQDLDPAREQRRRSEKLHDQLWEASVTGEGVTADGRVARDQYLRPGFLRVLYDQNKDALRDPPPSVRLQALIVSNAAAGGLEGARAVCAEQRAEIAAGKDFALAVEEYGAQLRESGGELGWIEIGRVFDPEVRAFVEESQPGSLSPVIDAVSGTGEVSGAQVLRVAELREGGDPPSFSDPRVQYRLATFHRRRLSEQRIADAERDLARQAYVWRASP